MKPRNNITALERHGFKDADLTDPLHDDIIMWLHNSEHSHLLNAYNFLKEKFQHLNIPAFDDFKLNNVDVERDWEVPVYSDSSSRFCIGYIDFRIIFTVRGITGLNGEQFRCYFEAKTKINSLGELFRQLNTYRPHVYGELVVVCPDDRHEEIIRSQGFGFLKYTGE